MKANDQTSMYPKLLNSWRHMQEYQGLTFFQVGAMYEGVSDFKFHFPRKGTQTILPFKIRCHTPMIVSSGIRREPIPLRNICPLKLHNVTKQAHWLPFSSTAQTAKNTDLTVKCCHYKNPRWLYSLSIKGKLWNWNKILFFSKLHTKFFSNS